jgi:uncharacterized protein with HEPN domain
MIEYTLLHILEATNQIEQYVHGFNYEKFKQSRLVQDGVIRQLEVIGEATKNLSDATRENAPEIAWRDMAGMRDVLIHQYFGVDISAVWDTVEHDIFRLKECVSKLLSNT